MIPDWGLAPPLLLAMLATPPQPTPTELERRIAERVRAFRGEMGVFARDLGTGEEAACAADTAFPSASLIKLGVMLEAFHQIEEGRLRREALVTLRDEDKVGEPVVLERLHAGLQLTVADLVFLMIAASDNTATNLLLAQLGSGTGSGAGAVNRRLEGYGLERTKLFRPTFRDGRADVLPELEREFGLGMTTPRDLGRLLERIADGRAVSPAASAAMLEILRAQHDRAMIPRRLPLEAGWQVANKTGEDLEKLPSATGLRGLVRGDAAIVLGPGVRYVVVVLTRRGADTRAGLDNDALVAGADVARMIHDHFTARRVR